MKVVDEAEVMGPENEGGQGVTAMAVSTAESMARAEFDSQVDIAKRHPRSIGKFMRDLESLVTINQAVAEKCFYVLKRKDKRTGETKRIEGKSIRFAEVAATCYKNIRYGAKVIEIGEKTVTVRGACFDLENNVGVEQDVQRRITTTGGMRYGEDMIAVTVNAGLSIAMRNSVLRMVPAAFTDPAYEKAKQVAIGDAKTLADRRQQMLERFSQMGASREEVLVYIEKPTIEDVTLGDMEDLIGLFNAIKDGTQTIDEAFNRGVKPTDQPTGKSGFGFKKPENGTAKTDPPKVEDPKKAPEQSLEDEARASEQAESQTERGTETREQLLAEIGLLHSNRRDGAATRSGLWKAKCGADPRGSVDLEKLRALRDHLRTVGGTQGSLA